MKKVIESNIREVEFDELRHSQVSEIIFEDPCNWFLSFDKVKLDYVMDYCQSTGRGEIVGSCVDTIESGEIKMNFTDDGKQNKKLIDSYTSATPGYDRVAVRYRTIFQK